jgi:transposase InsO family protein
MDMEGGSAMSWKEMDTMSLREEFVQLAVQKGSNIRFLCRRYQISSRTGYKWIKRYQAGGKEGLADASKRPKHSPKRTGEGIEQAVIQKREETGWGGRKIAKVLEKEMEGRPEKVPHPNTITDILRRNGKIKPAEAQKHTAWERFEYATPNELWQMDFKGHFAMLRGRCHPLTLLDDHSRFCLGLRACGEETIEITQYHLTSIFRLYGLPLALLCDNGGPWGGRYPQLELTRLTVWLIRLGIRIRHGRPIHPQTQGKDERFHRTLKAEVLQGPTFANLEDCQRNFDPFRDRYNLVRPHEALKLDTPSQHYQPSEVPFPETLPPIEYDSGQIVRKVQEGGIIYFEGREFRVGKALWGLPVLLSPTEADGCFDVFFCTTKIDQIQLDQPQP